MADYTPEQQQTLDRIKAECDEGNTRLAASTPAKIPPGARAVGSPGGYWRQQQARVLRMVPPGEILTQYGTTWFRPEPRYDGPIVEVAVSMLLGVRDVDFAARAVTKRPARPNATVRRFRTSDLWLNGYQLLHTPSERNPLHVSVFYGQIVGPDQRDQARASWADPSRVTLDALAISAGEAL